MSGRVSLNPLSWRSLQQSTGRVFMILGPEYIYVEYQGIVWTVQNIVQVRVDAYRTERYGSLISWGRGPVKFEFPVNSLQHKLQVPCKSSRK